MTAAVEKLCSSEEIVWIVKAASDPQVIRYCPDCATKSLFSSSGKFRVNAHQARLDVWLIYQCTECSNVWKHAILDRVLPSSIGSDLLGKYHGNDVDTAREHAADYAALRRNGAIIAEHAAFEVAGPSITSVSPTLASLLIRIVPQAQLHPRTDVVFARQLNIARSQVSRLVATEILKPAFGRRSFPKRASVELSAVLSVQGFLAEYSGSGRVPTPPGATVNSPEESETL